MSGNGRFVRVLGRIVVTIVLLAIACHGSDQTSCTCQGDSAGSSTHPANLGGTSGNNPGSKPHLVKLTWKAPVDAVKGYIVERKELGKDHGYRQISLTPIRETSCTDYDVTAGQSYSYRAKAVGRGGQVSRPSNAAKATVPSP